MIVCASRRTDIPAFHSEWFMNRLRSGHALVRNPVQKDVVYDVSLSKRDVDCIFFISKNPQPMEKHLDEIMSMGHDMMFHVTVNPYGKALEPNVPDIKSITNSFRRISSVIGKGRMTWRYDPVIFTDRYDIEFHKDSFRRICSELEGSTGRCAFSFLSPYDKLSEQYCSGTLRSVRTDERISFCKEIPKIASEYGIEVTSCCIDEDLSRHGVIRRACLDPADLRALNIPFDAGRVPTRENCLCLKSIDIGMYDTCMHNCLYCYANTADGRRRSSASYNPASEILYGSISDNDRIIKIGRRSNMRLTDFNEL